MADMVGIPVLLFIIFLFYTNLVISFLIFVAVLVGVASISGLWKDVKNNKLRGINIKEFPRPNFRPVEGQRTPKFPVD